MKGNNTSSESDEPFFESDKNKKKPVKRPIAQKEPRHRIAVKQPRLSSNARAQEFEPSSSTSASTLGAVDAVPLSSTTTSTSTVDPLPSSSTTTSTSTVDPLPSSLTTTSTSTLAAVDAVLSTSTSSTTSTECQSLASGSIADVLQPSSSAAATFMGSKIEEDEEEEEEEDASILTEKLQVR